MDRTVTRIHAVCDDLENHWSTALAEVNAGSIAVGVTLAYIDFRLSELNWRNGRPKLDAFHAGFSARPSMMKTALQAK